MLETAPPINLVLYLFIIVLKFTKDFIIKVQLTKWLLINIYKFCCHCIFWIFHSYLKKNVKYLKSLILIIFDFKDALKQCLYHRLPQMLKRIRVGIIIIDSIAAVFRGDYNINESIVRAKDLRDIGLQLHKLSSYFGTAILCVNQVILYKLSSK